MATDQQVIALRKLRLKGEKVKIAAMKAGMSEKTARKYLQSGKLPGEMRQPHTWRTRKDPFEEVWPGVREKLEINPGLQAKTLFEWLQREYSGRFSDGQLRTLQRRVKEWRALAGPGKEVFFPQEHHPGDLCESDFTDMTKLGVTIQGQRFEHLVYHFVLTYSNWETGSICFSESYESLSHGLQEALWKLGGVPKQHRTDRLTAAIKNLRNSAEFQSRYEGLLKHYGLQGSKTQADCPHENGDAEQRHYRFKVALDQALMLRGSRDFESREAYGRFLEELFDQLNYGRRERLAEDLRVLRPLPVRRLEESRKLDARVRSSSTIRVLSNVYSVPSRLIGEKVKVLVYMDHLDVWYGQRRVERLPRLRGHRKHDIQYRHVIDWLVRKPGAFANYQYRSDLFPTSLFRIAYDLLQEQRPARADKEYLGILYVAARETESGVNRALELLINEGHEISVERVKELVHSEGQPEHAREPKIDTVNVELYDDLLEYQEVA